jgi:uncharacterized protein (TIGR03437 family)
MRLQLVRFLTLSGIIIIPAFCQGTINTLAGTATCCNSADGGQATNSWLGSAAGITVDKQGNLYIWESSFSKVKKVSTAGIISTVAGNGSPGYTGDGGPATSAELFANGSVSGLAVDDAGNLYISDGENHAVRKVDTTGTITTVAGTGAPGFSGDGGPANKALLDFPAGIALDNAGNLYIADSSNNRVRRVDKAGIITTVAGNGNVSYSGDNVQATATAVDRPEGVTVDSRGNLYISETSDARVRKVDSAGVITTVAGLTKKTPGFSGDGGPATAAQLYGPIGMAVDSAGNLYIADNVNGRIRKVDAAGIITTYAGIDGNASTPIGDGGPATKAFLGVPKDVALDAAGTLYVAGSAGGVARVRKITAAAGLSTSPSALSYSHSIGGTAAADQTVNVTSSGAAASFTATPSTTSGGGWLSVTPTSGTTPATLTVHVNPAGLPGAVYQGAVTLTPSGGATQTFAVTLTVTGAGAPVFTSDKVLNALGYQATLAPDTVFVIFGGGMGPTTLTVANGTDYPNTLSGTSVTFTPAGGGTAIDARMVYTSAGQIAGLLPSSITPGTYEVRVTYNTLTSAAQNVTVAARSFGIATANSSGAGTAQATIGNVNGGISLTRFTTSSIAYGGYTWTLSPAHPGDTLVLWGTGGGADPANDTGGTSGDQTAAGSFSVLVAGRTITPLYAGASSGYPGLWQINFTLPADVTPDCFATLQVSAGGALSNTVSIPIAAAGQNACSDPQLSTDMLKVLDAGGTVVGGGIGISKSTMTTSYIATAGAPTTTTTTQQEIASAGFAVYTAAEYAATNAGVKIGACTVTDRTAPANAKAPATPDGYADAGARLPISGPGIAPGAGLAIYSTNPGPVYDLLFSSGTLGAGKYTVSGTGGTVVGAFSSTVPFPADFAASNLDAITTIDRTKPLTINWTGSSFDQVLITGSTYSVVGKDSSNNNILRTVIFNCQVPAGPGSYTVPTAVLSYLLPEGIDAASLAKGSGILAIQGVNSQTFSAPLVAGGQTAFAGVSATQAFSKNLAVQ